MESARGPSERSISDAYERTFLQVPLEKQIELCARDELVPLFRKWLPSNQPVLEAGCGSGKWVAWYLSQGWSAVGLDWSRDLCIRAKVAIPGGRFETGDMRAMPFDDGEFGAVVALGSIEHSPEGPDAALKDFRRVLRPGGIAITTVLYNGPVRRLGWGIRAPVFRARAVPWLRRFYGRPGWAGRSLLQAKRETATIREGRKVYRCNDDGWYFFEYQFSRAEMRRFLARNGFDVVEELVVKGDEGITQSFGPIAGRFDRHKAAVEFTPVGKLLRRVFPARVSGHMLCHVSRRV